MNPIALRTAATLLLLGGVASACEPAGCTNIMGIPVEARMTVWVCGLGPATKPLPISDELVTGRWTHKAHVLSPDRQANVIHRKAGLEIHFGGRRKFLPMDLAAHNPRQITWHADSRRIAFWAPLKKSAYVKRVALLDVRQIDTKRPLKILYTPAKGVRPFGMAWSPQGDAVYVIERRKVDKLGHTFLTRIDLATGAVTEVVRRLGIIDFFVVGPVTKGTFRILFGAEDGLYACGPRGKGQQRLGEALAVGIHSLALNPRSTEAALYLRFPLTRRDGTRMPRGIYRRDYAKPGWSPSPIRNSSVRSLWYSPKGTYLGWSNPKELRVEGSKGVALSVTNAAGELRGLAFSADETQVAYAEGSQVRVRRIADGTIVRTVQVPARKGAKSSRVEDLRWANGQLLVTQVSDASEEMRARRDKLRIPLTLPKRR